jgi:hypothetical protein
VRTALLLVRLSPYCAGWLSAGALGLAGAGDGVASVDGAGAAGCGAASCVTAGAGASAAGAGVLAAVSGAAAEAGAVRAVATLAGRVVTASDDAALRATFTGAGADADDLPVTESDLAGSEAGPDGAARSGVCTASLLARAPFWASFWAGAAGAGAGATAAVFSAGGGPPTSSALLCGTLVAAAMPMIATAATGTAIQP